MVSAFAQRFPKCEDIAREVRFFDASTHFIRSGLRVFSVSGPFDGFGTIFTASKIFAGDGAGLNTAPSPTLGSNTGKFNSFFGRRLEKETLWADLMASSDREQGC